MIQVKLLLGAVIPTKAHPKDAGFDLFSLERVSIFPGQMKSVHTGVHLAIPDGFYGQICGKSGLAFNKSVFPIGGVIDSTYRGEVKVRIFNGDLEGGSAFEINPGDPIAQIVVIRISDDDAMLAVDELDETLRGHSGFGSTSRYCGR